MALSEHEQHLLDEMERSLYQGDADFVAAGGRRGAPNYTAVTFGVLLALLGLGGAIAAVAARLPILGIVGFALMVGGVLLAFRRKQDSAPIPSTRGAGKRSGGGSPVMDSFEERWEKRKERRDQ